MLFLRLFNLNSVYYFLKSTSEAGRTQTAFSFVLIQCYSISKFNLRTIAQRDLIFQRLNLRLNRVC